jgi:hypothetical protein
MFDRFIVQYRSIIHNEPGKMKQDLYKITKERQNTAESSTAEVCTEKPHNEKRSNLEAAQNLLFTHFPWRKRMLMKI